MIPKSGNRFSEKDHAQIKRLERDDDSKKNHPALSSRIPAASGGGTVQLALLQAQQGDERKQKKDICCHENPSEHRGHVDAGGARSCRERRGERNQENGGGGNHQRSAEKIQPVTALMARQALHGTMGDQGGEEPERHVEPEDERPVQMLG